MTDSPRLGITWPTPSEGSLSHGMVPGGIQPTDLRERRLTLRFPVTTVCLLPQMTEGRRCQVHLLDDRKLELLVQVRPSGATFLVSSMIIECATEVDLVKDERGCLLFYVSV